MIIIIVLDISAVISAYLHRIFPSVFYLNIILCGDGSATKQDDQASVTFHYGWQKQSHFSFAQCFFPCQLTTAQSKNDTTEISRFYGLPKMDYNAPQIIIIPSIWGVSVGLLKLHDTHPSPTHPGLTPLKRSTTQHHKNPLPGLVDQSGMFSHHLSLMA